MSEQYSTCAPELFPPLPAIDWLEESGFYLYRNGCYDVQFDEVRVAYLCFCQTGNNRQLEYLDLLRWGATGGVRTEADVERLRDVELGLAVWCERLPPELLQDLNRSEKYYIHRSTYKFRRRKARDRKSVV